MRIIAGLYRSRALDAPAGLATRPTSDRLRETLFNVLAPRIQGARFLDLFAGSGAVGLEAISRGAAQVTFVEREPKAVVALRGNIERLKIPSGFRIQPRTVAAYFKSSPSEAFDLIFLDPPYDEGAEYSATLWALSAGASNLLAEDAVVIAEHRRKEPLESQYGKLKRTRLLEQGDAALSFYRTAY